MSSNATGMTLRPVNLAFARPWRFARTDQRMCVCGHTAAQHGADPGTTHRAGWRTPSAGAPRFPSRPACRPDQV